MEECARPSTRTVDAKRRRLAGPQHGRPVAWHGHHTLQPHAVVLTVQPHVVLRRVQSPDPHTVRLGRRAVARQFPPVDAELCRQRHGDHCRGARHAASLHEPGAQSQAHAPVALWAEEGRGVTVAVGAGVGFTKHLHLTSQYFPTSVSRKCRD